MFLLFLFIPRLLSITDSCSSYLNSHTVFHSSNGYLIKWEMTVACASNKCLFRECDIYFACIIPLFSNYSPTHQKYRYLPVDSWWNMFTYRRAFFPGHGWLGSRDRTGVNNSWTTVTSKTNVLLTITITTMLFFTFIFMSKFSNQVCATTTIVNSSTTGHIHISQLPQLQQLFFVMLIVGYC